MLFEERGTLPIARGGKTCTDVLEISLAVLQEEGTCSISRSSYVTLGLYSKEASSYYRDTCSGIFIVAFFKIVRN